MQGSLDRLDTVVQEQNNDLVQQVQDVKQEVNGSLQTTNLIGFGILGTGVVALVGVGLVLIKPGPP